MSTRGTRAPQPAGRPVRAGPGLWGGRWFVFDSLPSTNQWALDHAARGRHGDAVLALEQTAGRGRFQRSWFSRAERSLTLSVLVKSGTPESRSPTPLAMACALAVRALLRGSGLAAFLRWPNDVLVGEKKICGILAEQAAASGDIALGIGLNVNLSRTDLRSLPLRAPATSMAIETGKTFDIRAVCRDLLCRLRDEFASAADPRAGGWRLRWRQADALRGRMIAVRAAGRAIRGRYAGLDDQGRLRVVDDAGTERRFWSGDVSLVRPARRPGFTPPPRGTRPPRG